MNDKLYKFLMQVAVLGCIIYLATIGMFESESLNLIFGTIVGYLFNTAKSYINKKDDDK